MSNQMLFHTTEIADVMQAEFNIATGMQALIDGEPNHTYIRWLEIRVYELEGRPQPQHPKEYCSGCNQMVHFEDPVSPWPMCPNCLDKDERGE